MFTNRIITAVIILLFAFSMSFAQQEEKKSDTDTKKDKWKNTVWKKVGKLAKEKRTFQVEKATTVAGVRGAEAEDEIIKQLYYKGKGQFPTKLELKNAIDMLKQIIKTEPDAASVSETKYYIGEIYSQLGENQQAIDTFEDIVKNHPDSEYAKEATVRIGELKK